MTAGIELDFNPAVKAVREAIVSAVVPSLNRAGVINRFGYDVKAMLPRVVKVEELSPGFKASFLNLTAEGFLPEIYFGHFTQLDHVVLSHGLNELIQLAASAGYAEKLRRIAMTLASTVPEGQQSPLMQVMYEMMEAYANGNNVDFVRVTREEDVQKYRKRPSINEKKPLIAMLRGRDIGLAIPAGGSIEPGRHDKGQKGDNIKGLQKITDKDLVTVYTTMERYGPAYYLPSAVVGTWRFFSADSLLPTLETFANFYHDRQVILAGIFGFNMAKFFGFLGIRHDIGIEIRFGMPITKEEVARNLGSEWRKHSMDVNLFLMTRQAMLLPDYAQGYYRRFVQENLASKAIELSSVP